ncbi:MAG: ComF family protein [Bacillaceae bacterium]
MKCVYCQSEITSRFLWYSFLFPEQRVICDACEQLFSPISGVICKRCGRLEEAEYCYDCQRWMEKEDYLIYNRSLYHYDEAMKEWFTRFKFRGDVALLQMFSEQWRKTYKQFFNGIDGVVPIPLSKQRSYERTFNQAYLLAQLVEVPIIHALDRIHSEKQSKKGRSERLMRENVFNGIVDVSGKKLVLIDDLYTTGVTLQQGAFILNQCGAKEVYGYTLARA